VRAVKPLVSVAIFGLVVAAPLGARADVANDDAAASAAPREHGKAAGAPHKLGYEARMFVVDKDAPPADKTVRLARGPLPALKDK
jgi:hypothetical protein